MIEVLKRLGFVDLHAAIREKVESKTGLKCLDAVPKNQPSPFYFAEIVGKEADNTKTMWCDTFLVYIHAIAETNKGSDQIYELIEKLEESLTEKISLPEGFNLAMQTEQGLVSLKTDETGEKHAILAYSFKVCYGFKIKI